MIPALLYGFTGIALFLAGAAGVVWISATLRRVVAANIMGVGVFLVLIATAYRGPHTPADPLPHALVLTGIVVAVSATALALALHRWLSREAADE